MNRSTEARPKVGSWYRGQVSGSGLSQKDTGTIWAFPWTKLTTEDQEEIFQLWNECSYIDIWDPVYTGTLVHWCICISVRVQQSTYSLFWKSRDLGVLGRTQPWRLFPVPWVPYPSVTLLVTWVLTQSFTSAPAMPQVNALAVEEVMQNLSWQPIGCYLFTGMCLKGQERFEDISKQ